MERRDEERQAAESARRLEGLEGADPEFPVPDTVAQLPLSGELTAASSVCEEEFAWMEAQRPLTANLSSLTVDYGGAEAEAITAAFTDAGLQHLLGALAWPGVGTRWREFLAWCQGCDGSPPATPQAGLRGFGRFLGRVVTYRALAIDAAALQRILSADCIFPSGQLRVGSETLSRVVDEKGVLTVCVARLFIAHLRKLLGHDPSISLHDDWQTTSLIASGYASCDKLDPSRSRKVHLFEVSCPKVESIGWTLDEVALRADEVLPSQKAGHEPWFCFPAPASQRGVWFDGRLQRTERYGLYGVPFLSQRLRRLFVFESVEEVGEAIAPFAERQEELHARG